MPADKVVRDGDSCLAGLKCVKVFIRSTVSHGLMVFHCQSHIGSQLLRLFELAHKRSRLVLSLLLIVSEQRLGVLERGSSLTHVAFRELS